MATKGDARVWPDLADRTSVTLTVSDHSVELARRTVVRRSSVPELRQKSLTVARDGMVGVYFQPPHTDRPKPAVLMLGGSEGGLQPTLLAKMLAVHGYPTLRLAYFDAPGLPRYLDKIPVEYASGTGSDWRLALRGDWRGPASTRTGWSCWAPRAAGNWPSCSACTTRTWYTVWSR